MTVELMPGYKQTEAGVIPEDWGVEKLKDIVSKVIDNRGKTPPYSNNADVELIESTSISFVNQYPDYSKVTKFVSDYVYKNWFRGHPLKNDILISTVGEYSGSSALMKENRGTVAQNLIALQLKGVNSAFVFYWTRSKGYKQQLNQVMMSQAQPSLRVPWLLNFFLMFPPTKAEQEAIAEALCDTDTFIESLEQLITKKRHIKQGAMQELLTGKKRLPGFSGEWEVKRLGDVIEKFVGGGTPSRSISHYWGDVIPWVTVKDFSTFNPCDSQEAITRAGLDNSASHLIPKGMLITSTRMTLGKAVVYEVDVAINQDLKALFPKPVLETKYLYFWFQLYGHAIDELGSGSTVKGISLPDLKKIEFKLPPRSEQTAIATILSDMDAEIAALEAKLAKTRSLKQGMMHNLLTGRIRLIESGKLRMESGG